MTATVVRYQAKADRADENQKLIEAVFADLDARQPDGFTYKVFRLEDGVSFVHVVIEHDDVDRPRLVAGRPRVQVFVSHRNARLTVHGRRLLVHRVRRQGMPVAHVAKAMGDLASVRPSVGRSLRR